MEVEGGEFELCVVLDGQLERGGVAVFVYPEGEVDAEAAGIGDAVMSATERFQGETPRLFGLLA